jgi:hypothetical protein
VDLTALATEQHRRELLDLDLRPTYGCVRATMEG